MMTDNERTDAWFKIGVKLTQMGDCLSRAMDQLEGEQDSASWNYVFDQVQRAINLHGTIDEECRDLILDEALPVNIPWAEAIDGCIIV